MQKLCSIAFIGITLILNPILGNAESYKVFKADGISFRYPDDWEEGLSQAETTKVLVRAISSRTGYAASCTVNVSFVDGLDKYSQDRINAGNHRVHDFKYLSRLKDDIPDFKVLTYNTNSFLSMQQASFIEFTATVRGHTSSQINQFFSIMTIKKPNRYVVTCRGEPANYLKAKKSIDLIVDTLLID